MIIDRNALSNPLYAEDVVNLLEHEIENLKFEKRAALARASETSKVCSFMIEVVAREAWNARHTESGEFEEWWGKRKVIIDEGN